MTGTEIVKSFEVHNLEISPEGRMRCSRCKNDASPLFLGVEQESFEPFSVKAIAYCRGCINLYEPGKAQEHQVSK